jgi:ABC-2 type transport system ATP-binding protein
MLASLIRPTSGTATVSGLRIDRPEEARQIRRMVGMLTETTGFYENLSVIRNLRFYADLYGIPRARADAAIDGYLRLFDLLKWKNSIIGGFSRGMRQKLALIRCLVHDPAVLFLDEPTSGLDPESARVVREAVLRLRREGKAIIVCTHNLDEAERLCDRVAIINRRILCSGTPGKLMSAAYGRRIVVRLEQAGGHVHEAISGLSVVAGVEEEGDRLIIDVEDPDRSCADIVNAIVRAGGRIRSVGELRHSMEDVYLKLIGERCGT